MISPRNTVFPAISVNKGGHSHQRLQPSKVNIWALRKLRAENSICQLASSRLQPFPKEWALRKLSMWKCRILIPDSWGAYQRNDFGEPRLLHLPIHRKVINTLTLDIWFSLINSNFWYSVSLPFVAKFLYILPPCLPPWSSFSQLSEKLSPRLRSSFCHK